MTISVMQRTSEPIINLEFDDSADEASVLAAYRSSMDIADHIAGPVYRIIDVRRASTSYAQIVETIRGVLQGMAGAATTPQMLIAFVGTPNMFVNGITFFETPEEALAEARSYVAETAVSL